MRRYVFFIIMIMFFILSANAQNRNTLLQRMNEIKTQSDVYFWDQYTHPDDDTAKVKSTERLLLDINSYRSESEQFTVNEIMTHVTYININRGNLRQSFVYIKKADTILIRNGIKELNIVENNANSNINSIPTIIPHQKSFVPEAFVQRIMETKYFTNIYKLLKSLKTEGQILQFGKLKDVEDYSSLDLILFDMQSQEVITMLSPETPSGNRINLFNGLEDSLNNYPTNLTAVIWFIKK